MPAGIEAAIRYFWGRTVGSRASNGGSVTKLSLKGQGLKQGRVTVSNRVTHLDSRRCVVQGTFRKSSAPPRDGKAETGVMMNGTVPDLGHVSSLDVITKLM